MKTTPTSPDRLSIRAARCERLLRGTLGDLERAENSKSLGWTTWVNGEPIDDAIASLRRTADAYRGLGGSL